MAIDTQQKRATAFQFMIFIYTPGVVPSGSITQADRQASVLNYSGILASGEVVAGIIGMPSMPTMVVMPKMGRQGERYG